MGHDEGGCCDRPAINEDVAIVEHMNCHHSVITCEQSESDGLLQGVQIAAKLCLVTLISSKADAEIQNSYHNPNSFTIYIINH
jgi:hypothetical protein